MMEVLLLVLDVATAVYSALFGSYPKISLFDATSYRILYIHVPLAWDMYFAFTVTFVFSLLYLIKEKERFDTLSFCSAVLGVIYGFGAIVSGMLWANEVWHSYWSWDPRQTSTLTALLAYLGYIALRTSIPDVEKARNVSSVFGVSAYVTIPLSYLSAVTFRSLHRELPQQPIGMEGYALLTLRVLVSFIAFLTILRLYYRRVEGEV